MGRRWLGRRLWRRLWRRDATGTSHPLWVAGPASEAKVAAVSSPQGGEWGGGGRGGVMRLGRRIHFGWWARRAKPKWLRCPHRRVGNGAAVAGAAAVAARPWRRLWRRDATGTSHPRVIMTTYDPVSENLAATEPGTGGEAEGNCVAARRGGKQPEAKEQSQRQLNSIRCEFAASLRGTGEACEKSNPSSRHRPANARDGANWHGWSENAPKEVCVSGESCADRHRARSARTVQQSEPPYERGSPVTRMEQREAGK
jgi:hypothetical protein